MRTRIIIAAVLIVLALVAQAAWYHGMRSKVVTAADQLRKHFSDELDDTLHDKSRSHETLRLHGRAVGLVKIVTNTWPPSFVIQCALCAGAIGVLLARPRKELRAHGGAGTSAQPSDGTDAAR